MPLTPEERARLHRRLLHDHLRFVTPEVARWLTEADIHAQAIAEVMREREHLHPDVAPAYTGPKRAK